MDLYEACENGNEERVVELLLGATDDGATRLHARRGGVAGSAMAGVVARSLGATGRPGASASAQLRQRGPAGRTALLAACMGGQAGVVRLLLGESCAVHFTSRSRQETLALLAPLTSVDSSCDVHMVTKDGGVELVPMAVVRLPPQWVVAPQELLEPRVHVDDFGNTPLQCVSCFGCGSVTRHVDDGLAITRQLLLHGDQPNVPKHASHWTPLHWSAYHGNHEQAALLLDPQTHVGGGQRRFGRTQMAIPLLPDVDGHFPVDIAGRRGLALREEMTALRRQARRGQQDAHAAWRLRLDHVDVVRLFVREFLRGASHLTRYVGDMNARRPAPMANSSHKRRRRRRRGLLRADAVRYGQHLLYWAGCFGLESEVRALLHLRLQDGAVEKSLKNQQEDEDKRVRLWTLYVCSCEVDKRQSVLHAAAAHGQLDVLLLLVDELLCDQREERSVVLGSRASALQRGGSNAQAARKKSLVVPSAKEPAETPAQRDATQQDARLDVLALLSCGWLSQRNETPLFVAALFLRQSVVQALVRVLSASSLAWELHHCNVEGSSLQDIASDAARELLGLTAQPPAHAEYVLLFDGLRKRAFKESLIETVREESASAPSLVATRAGSRELRAAGRLQGRQMVDYVVVGVTADVLVRHAQTLQLKVKHRGSAVRSQFDAAAAERFEPLRSLQRQQVVRSLVQRNLSLQRHLRLGNLRAVFPLHDAPGCRNIMRHWVASDVQRGVFQPLEAASLRQLVLERREHAYELLWPLLTYFGEKHAFYYAFGAFYTAWLLALALPGAVCQLLWLADGLHFASPLFAVAVSIWATLLVERWKRKRSEIQRCFGHFRRNRSEQAPGFYGDFQPDAAHAAVDLSFPRSLQLVRIYSGMLVLLSVGVGAVAVFVAVQTTLATSALVHRALPWLPATLVPYAVPFLNAVAMLLLDHVYTRLARLLTGWENHRTVWQFESMLAAKLFAFKFLNAFLSLFWVAFVEQDAATLRQQLLMAMAVRQLWTSAVRDVLPLVHVRYRWTKAGFVFRAATSARASSRATFWSLAGREWYNAALRCPPASSCDDAQTDAEEAAGPPPEVLLQELMYPPDFLLGKQMETVLQFGYITMFVSVLPVAPLLALLSNVVATRLDVLSCVQVKQRPPFESETEVTTFMSILEFMSFAAVAVNCAVLFFTTRSDFESLLRVLAPDWMAASMAAPEHSHDFYLKELWVLVAIEHVVLGAKALLSLTIDDSAAWVRADEDRSDDEEKRRTLEDTRAGCVQSAELDALVAVRDRGDAPLLLSPRSSEKVVDELLAHVVAVPAASGASGSALQRVLLEKYLAVVRERDAALHRERTAQQKLLALTLAAASARAEKAPETGASGHDESSEPAEDVSEETDDSAAPAGESGRTLPAKRRCFVCYALRNVTLASERRCLSCHVSVCLACDVLLHLDDLGVQEATHFRVDMPVSVAAEKESSSSTTADLNVHIHLDAPAAQHKRDNPVKQRNDDHLAVLSELRRLVEAFVTRNRATALPLSSREAVQRCTLHTHVALRYLRNHERQRLHVEDHGHRELQ